MKKGKRLAVLFLCIAVMTASALPATAQVQAAKTTVSSKTAKKPGWRTVNKKRLFIGVNGKRVTGFQKINGRYYFFDSKGILTWFQKGSRYFTINARGREKRLDTVRELAARRLVKLAGGSVPAKAALLRRAFQWSAALPYYAVSTAGMDWKYFAGYGFQRNQGDCNVQACTFYIMAKMLGYSAHYMRGSVPQSNGVSGSHAWVELDEKKGVFVYDPNFAGQYGARFGVDTGYRFVYGTKNTYKYQNVTRVN